MSELPGRDTTKPAEKQGLFAKFIIRRTDGSDAPGGKHDGCDYFVLDVTHDPHAKAALAAYAEVVRATHPLLADDMIERYGLAEPTTGNWIAAEDYHRNVRALDVALNGEEGAAQRPMLIDVLAQVEQAARELGRPVLAALAAPPQGASSGWTEQAAVDLAQRAGFSGTCWTMGPYELVHMLNMAASPLPAPQEPADWADQVEQRLLTWRQRFMNKSGDQLALDDFMGQESIDDLIDFVCAPLYAAPAPVDERARPKKPLLHCQNCGLTRITGSGPCDECGGEDFRTFDKLTNRITGEPLNAPVDEPRE